VARRRQSGGSGEAQTRRHGALEQGHPRGGDSAGIGYSPLRDDVRRQLVLDKGDAVAQDQLALLEPLHLEQVRAWGVLQGRDRGVEVTVLLLQARQLLPQLAFFVLGHRHRCFEARPQPFTLPGAETAAKYLVSPVAVQATVENRRVKRECCGAQSKPLRDEPEKV